MKAILLSSLLVLSLLAGCGTQAATSSSSVPETTPPITSAAPSQEVIAAPSESSESTVPLPLSDKVVRITSQGNTTTFQLYDTTAATEFYEQLPLELELSDFAGAQWMFYPPQRLNVRPEEAYHDGKKGELSYYEPWGDVFMLHQDFHSGDDMHRLGICLGGVNGISAMSGVAVIEKEVPDKAAPSQPEVTGPTGETIITVQSGDIVIPFALSDSQAAKDLLAQLPLEIEVENFSSNEKIFYPPEKLDTTNAPIAEGGTGTLAYYAPWGDVVMFYDSFSSNGSLYQLGKAVSGAGQIGGLSGTIRITAGALEPSETAPEQTGTEGVTENTMKIQAGNITFTATLADNSSAAALKELLAQGPLTIQMSDYGNMEKVGPIGQSLPRNDTQTTTGPGDIILYQGNSLVIYYDTNSWNFTPIGKIEGVTQEELLAALGNGSVSVTFSLD